MSDGPADNNQGTSSGKPSVPVKNVAVVQCNGFRCLAYWDSDRWRDFQTGGELLEVQEVVFTFGPS